MINCIICKNELDNFAYDDHRSHPHPISGLAFYTHGHYGTTFFDPMDGSSLHIVICDKCLVQNEKYTIRKRPL